jgi:hypothetical protein
MKLFCQIKKALDIELDQLMCLVTPLQLFLTLGKSTTTTIMCIFVLLLLLHFLHFTTFVIILQQCHVHSTSHGGKVHRL